MLPFEFMVTWSFESEPKIDSVSHINFSAFHEDSEFMPNLRNTYVYIEVLLFVDNCAREKPIIKIVSDETRTKKVLIDKTNSMVPMYRIEK